MKKLLIRIYNRVRLMLTRQRLKRRSTFDYNFDVACHDFAILQKKIEIKSLLEYVEARNPRVIGEIGSYKCGTSFLMTQKFTDAKKIIFIDRKLFNEELLMYYHHSQAKIHFVTGDSVSSEVRNNVLAVLGETQYDFLFIDGDHSYDGVRNDLINYYDLVRDGGMIAFHDIVSDHRTRFNIKSGGYSGEVYKVWAAIKDHFISVEFIESRDQDGFGIGLIIKDAGLPLAELAGLLEKPAASSGHAATM